MKQSNEINSNPEYTITADTILFFDMDGTLVDTNFANFLSYQSAITSITKLDYNLSYNPDKRFNRSNLKKIIPNLSQIEYNEIIEEKEKNFNGFIAESKLIRHTVDILLKYFETNQTVLVTNCREERALTVLKHFKLADKFNHFFFRLLPDNNKRINKFQNAISKLKISPNLIMAFEDEETEITDAKQAGIKVINPKISF